MSKFITITGRYFTEETLADFMEHFPKVYDALDLAISHNLRLKREPFLSDLLLKHYSFSVEHITSRVAIILMDAPHPDVPTDELQAALKWLNEK